MRASNVYANQPQNLLDPDIWKDSLTLLATATGFSLSVFSLEGELIYTTTAIHPLCEAIHSTPVFCSRCDLSCRRIDEHARTGKAPKIFKCSAKIVNFALPIGHHGARVIILGQGSFSGYDDIRFFAAHFSSRPLQTAELTMPPTFTSMAQARSVCHLLEQFVNDRLRSKYENLSLNKRIEGLRSILEHWTASSQIDPEMLYRQLLNNLEVFSDGRSLTLYVLDKKSGRYAPKIHRGKKNEGRAAQAAISAQDPLLTRLLAGEQCVVIERNLAVDESAGSEMRAGPAVYPLMVNGRIECLLAVADPGPSRNDSRVITAFCRQAGLAIENNQQHQELYRKFDRLAAVATLTEPLVPLDNEQGLLQSILEKSADLLLAEQGSLMLLDQETDALFLEATKGTVKGTREKIHVRKGVGIAGKVAEFGEPLLVANIEDDPRIGKKSRSRYKTSSFVSVPLKIKERVIGVLSLTDKSTGAAFDEEDLQLAQAFASHAAVVLERKELSEQMEKLKKLSITDPLTGLLSRRYLHDRLEEELARSQRFNRQLSVLMLDLDGFKQYNDTFGHLAGDRILEAIAVVIMNSVRSIDIVARYGGDEFTIILPETGISMAVLIGERLRSDIAKTALPVSQGGKSEHTITASIGIACYPEHDTTANSLIDRADSALFRAKTGGKNRIEVYT